MVKKAVKQFLTYGVGSIARSALTFLLLPLYLRYFSTEEYGVISILAIIITLSGIFLTAGVVSGLFRLYYDSEVTKRRKLVGITWLWYSFGGIAGLFLLYIFSFRISILLFNTVEYRQAIRLLGYYLLLYFLMEIPFNLLRLEKKSILYVGFSLAQVLTDFCLKILFVAYLKRGVNGYFESSIITHILIICAMMPYVLKYITVSLKLEYFKELLKLGFPFIFSSIAIWTLTVSDRFILNYFSGVGEVGVYSLADKFASIFNIVLFKPSALFWAPFFFSFANKNSEEAIKGLLDKSLKYFLIIGSFLYLAISLGSVDIMKILKNYFGARQEYLSALDLIPILTLGPFLYLLTRQAGYALLYIKKPKYSAIASCVAAGANIVLNLLIIPVLGSLGAALTTAFSYLLYIILIYWWSQKKYRVNYHFRSIVKIIIYLSVSFAASWFISLERSLFSLIIRETVGIGSFTIFILLDRDVFNKSEKEIISEYIIRIRKKVLPI